MDTSSNRIVFILILCIAVGVGGILLQRNLTAKSPRALPVAALVPTPSGKPVVLSGQLHIGYATETLSNPFWTTVSNAANEVAKTKNVTVTVLGSEDIAGEVKNAEDLIQQKVDVLVLTPWDAQGIIPVVEKANAAGIPVLTVDQNAAGGKVETYIATDNVLGGKLAGYWLAEALGGSGKIAVLEGKAGATTNNDRLSGFHEVLKMYPKIQVVVSLTANWKRDQGLTVMSDILTAHPDLNGVMALNDEMALGAMEAIKSANKTNQILLVGYNGADEAIRQVNTGNIAADVVQYPEIMGRLMVEWAIRIKNGEKPPARLNPGVNVIDTTTLKKAFTAISKGK